jgi:chromosome segregation ATPase
MSEEVPQPLPDDALRLILARLDSIDARLTTLEEKVDRRLQETRPIWEQVLARLDTLEAEMRTGFRRISREMGVVGKDMYELRAAQQDLEVRVEKLEEGDTPQ